jgi:hypothetical protein
MICMLTSSIAIGTHPDLSLSVLQAGNLSLDESSQSHVQDRLIKFQSSAQHLAKVKEFMTRYAYPGILYLRTCKEVEVLLRKAT